MTLNNYKSSTKETVAHYNHFGKIGQLQTVTTVIINP